MTKTVLVLTNSEDGEHTDSVIGHLEKASQPTFRLNVDSLASGKTQIVVESENGKFDFNFSDEAETLSSQDIGAVWYRRPFTVKSFIQNPAQAAHAKLEIENLLEGLWYTLSDVFWLSNPWSLVRARRKMLQLKVASNFGFNVPRTLVTNDPYRARSFVESCKEGAIYKTIHRSYIEAGDIGFSVKTTVVTPDLKNKLELIRKLPGLFQEQIRKSYELRVTVVGRQIFAVRIESQKFTETSVDWREPKFVEKLDYTAIDLPDDITESIFRMMDFFDLQFGAFDLAVDTNGKYWFFEINSNGQWYWLEYETDLLISKAIADILIINANAGV